MPAPRMAILERAMARSNNPPMNNVNGRVVANRVSTPVITADKGVLASIPPLMARAVSFKRIAFA